MKQKIFFIHVGKTAGSSFNHFLQKRLNGVFHCERYLNPDGLSFSHLEYLKRLDYVSGHIRYPIFETYFPVERYFSLAFLREPFSHLISHINWVMRIYDISPHSFQNYPKIIQDICLELRSLDLYDPDSFIQALIQFGGLFKNNQSRYFTQGQENVCGAEAIETLSKLSMVGLTEFYEASLRQFVALNQLDTTIEVDFENQNLHYRVHPDIYNNPLIQEFVAEYNDADIEVYSYFLKQFQQSQALQYSEKLVSV
jgi:hypothetical protein